MQGPEHQRNSKSAREPQQRRQRGARTPCWATAPQAARAGSSGLIAARGARRASHHPKGRAPAGAVTRTTRQPSGRSAPSKRQQQGHEQHSTGTTPDLSRGAAARAHAAAKMSRNAHTQNWNTHIPPRQRKTHSTGPCGNDSWQQPGAPAVLLCYVLKVLLFVCITASGCRPQGPAYPPGTELPPFLPWLVNLLAVLFDQAPAAAMCVCM